MGPERFRRTVVVDERRGFFTFAELNAGVFSISASRSGFSGGGYAQQTPRGPTSPLDLAPGEHVDVRLVLWRNPIVRGRVEDESGDPVVKVNVRAFMQTFVGGHPNALPNLIATTNDLGEYSLSLTPGTYFVGIPAVAVSALSARNRVLDPLLTAGYPTTFYPATNTLATAAPLELVAGAERSGIDFRLQKARMFRVAGAVVGLESPRPPVELKLVPSSGNSDSGDVDSVRTFTTPDGTFEFAMVPPGGYNIRAVAYPAQRAVEGTIAAFQTRDGSGFVGFRPGADAPIAPVPTGSTIWADVPIRVEDRDLLQLSVRLRRGAHLSGQLAFRGTAERPSDEKLATTPLVILAADGRDLGQLPLTRIQPGGRFTTVGLPPGKYILSPPIGLGQWRIGAVSLAERDQDPAIVLGTDDIQHLVVTLTDGSTSVSGTVRDENGGLQPHAPIFVFPKDRRLWSDFGPWPSRIRQVQASRLSRWQVRDLPAGDYYVVSTSASIPQGWMHEAVFGRLARMASSMRVADGQSQTLNLTTHSRW
jgi:hypothetical protein